MTHFDNRFIQLLAQKQTQENKIIGKAEVAKETGIAYTTLQRWEDGEVARLDYKIISKLCDYFGCTMYDLVVPYPQASQQGNTVADTVPIAV